MMAGGTVEIDLWTGRDYKIFLRAAAVEEMDELDGLTDCQSLGA